MSNISIIEQLREMRLSAMAREFEAQSKDPATYCVSRSEDRSCTGFEPHSRRSWNRTSAAHLTAHGLPDIISTAHIV